MKLSVVIPARDEAGSISATLLGLSAALAQERVDYELLVVDDGSADGTGDLVRGLATADPRIRCLTSPNPPGFGFAVRAGLAEFTGDAVAIVMADGSDGPDDVILYHRLLEEGYDCVFGSRFVRGSRVAGYPLFKRVLNRLVNAGIRFLFRHGYNDTTNAFKAYRREVIDTVQPLVSNHFNLTVELPLKAIVRGHSYAVVPISWTNRRYGTSKLALQEMGSRYLLSLLAVFFEHHLSRGDYVRPNVAGANVKLRPGHIPDSLVRAR
jgi:dolichol-phosphate mannosyltransferase